MEKLEKKNSQTTPPQAIIRPTPRNIINPNTAVQTCAKTFESLPAIQSSFLKYDVART